MLMDEDDFVQVLRNGNVELQKLYGLSLLLLFSLVFDRISDLLNYIIKEPSPDANEKIGYKYFAFLLLSDFLLLPANC